MSELSETERYKLQAAFWQNVLLSTAFRNIINKWEEGKPGDIVARLIENYIAVGMGAGSFKEDEFNTEGMNEEEIAMRTEWRKDQLPWSIVKECCEMWDVDPDPICDAYWQDMEEGLAQNRAFFGIGD
jgi:hypothetical protein